MDTMTFPPLSIKPETKQNQIYSGYIPSNNEFYHLPFTILYLQVVHGVEAHDEPHHIIRKRSLDHPIRILLYYDYSVYRYVGIL